MRASSLSVKAIPDFQMDSYMKNVAQALPMFRAFEEQGPVHRSRHVAGLVVKKWLHPKR